MNKPNHINLFPIHLHMQYFQLLIFSICSTECSPPTVLLSCSFHRKLVWILYSDACCMSYHMNHLDFFIRISTDRGIWEKWDEYLYWKTGAHPLWICTTTKSKRFWRQSNPGRSFSSHLMSQHTKWVVRFMTVSVNGLYRVWKWTLAPSKSWSTVYKGFTISSYGETSILQFT
jgi:hypothetical protein